MYPDGTKHAVWSLCTLAGSNDVDKRKLEIVFWGREFSKQHVGPLVQAQQKV